MWIVTPYIRTTHVVYKCNRTIGWGESVADCGFHNLNGERLGQFWVLWRCEAQACTCLSMSAVFEVDGWWLLWHTWIAAIHKSVTILPPSCTMRHVKMRGIARWEIMTSKWLLLDYDMHILSLCCSPWHQPRSHPCHKKGECIQHVGLWYDTRPTLAMLYTHEMFASDVWYRTCVCVDLD